MIFQSNEDTIFIQKGAQCECRWLGKNMPEGVAEIPFSWDASRSFAFGYTMSDWMTEQLCAKD